MTTMKVLVAPMIVFVLFIGAHGASVDIYDEPVYDAESETVRGVDNPVTKAMRGTDNGINTDDLEPYDNDPLNDQPVGARRFSCDMWSIQSKRTFPNHSTCAIRCFAHRRTGGRCENGMCKCRSDRRSEPDDSRCINEIYRCI